MRLLLCDSLRLRFQYQHIKPLLQTHRLAIGSVHFPQVSLPFFALTLRQPFQRFTKAAAHGADHIQQPIEQILRSLNGLRSGSVSAGQQGIEHFAGKRLFLEHAGNDLVKRIPGVLITQLCWWLRWHLPLADRQRVVALPPVAHRLGGVFLQLPQAFDGLGAGHEGHAHRMRDLFTHLHQNPFVGQHGMLGKHFGINRQNESPAGTLCHTQTRPAFVFDQGNSAKQHAQASAFTRITIQHGLQCPQCPQFLRPYDAFKQLELHDPFLHFPQRAASWVKHGHHAFHAVTSVAFALFGLGGLLRDAQRLLNVGNRIRQRRRFAAGQHLLQVFQE